MPANPSADRPSQRPKNHEVEDENVRCDSRSGRPPRPATEPKDAEGSVRSSKTATDPGSGEAKGRR